MYVAFYYIFIANIKKISLVLNFSNENLVMKFLRIIKVASGHGSFFPEALHSAEINLHINI